MKMLTRHDLAERWSTSIRTIDRRRKFGLIRWIDLSGGRGGRPIVRFRLSDVEHYEEKMTQ
jgi:hypothetical protein